MKMEMENICAQCDCVVDTECDYDDFWARKVGRIRCPDCGGIILPCNECAAEIPYNERDCDNCPWKKASILKEKKRRGDMEKIWVSESDVYKAIERDCGYRGRQHITGWWYDGDDIAFDNNRKEWGAEHYTLMDFVAVMCNRIPAVNAAKCNQFGTEYKDGRKRFFFYRDEGATDCHHE